MKALKNKKYSVGGNIEGEKPIGEGRYTTEEYRDLSKKRAKARNKISTGSPLLKRYRRGQVKRLTRKMSDTQQYTDTNPRG